MSQEYHPRVRQLLIQKQISVQDVVEIQAFVECIESLFETITNFLHLVKNRRSQKLSDDHLIKMNDVVIRCLNAFGVSCKLYKQDKRALTIGREIFEENWKKLSVQDQTSASAYGDYIDAALNGKKMKLYPLIKKSKSRKQRLNEKSVNEAYSEAIGGQCTMNKIQDDIRNNPTKYAKSHDEKHKRQQNKKQKRQNRKKTNTQPQANSLIMIPGQNNIRFETDNDKDNDGDSDMKESNNKHSHSNCNHSHSNCNHSHSHAHNGKQVITNTSLKIEIPGTANYDRLEKGLPAQILRDNNVTKDVRFANKLELNGVPKHYFETNLKKVKQCERVYIAAYGPLGYKSLLSESEENKLTKGYKSFIQQIFG